MDRLKNLAILQEVVAEVLAVEPGVIVEQAAFREDLGADSLDLIEIVMALEDQLGVSIPEQGLKEVITVGQALDLVSRHDRATS